MKISKFTMGMPATVTISDDTAKENDIDEIFFYFQHIDEIFSTYKSTSEISRINIGLLSLKDASWEVREVLQLCDKAQKETNGYFDMYKDNKIDPSGMVKGYAIHQAAGKLRKKGYKNFFVEIAGDVEVQGFNEDREKWRVGIESPFVKGEIVKIVALSNKGIATSGNYKQGQHIYNPIEKNQADEIMSMTVVAESVQKADMLATATFAMGEKGITFLEKLSNVEGYMIQKDKTAVWTRGTERYFV